MLLALPFWAGYFRPGSCDGVILLFFSLSKKMRFIKANKAWGKRFWAMGYIPADKNASIDRHGTMLTSVSTIHTCESLIGCRYPQRPLCRQEGRRREK